MPRPHIPLEQRYEAHIERVPGGCWVWHGNRNQRGYGQFRVGRTGNGPVISVHRWAFERWKGPIPPGLWVLHTCDNPRCSNPDHLYAGTAKQNSADKLERHPNARGYKLPFRPRRGILSDDDVRAIRVAEGNCSEIGAKFLVSDVYVAQIRNRTRKANVPDLDPRTLRAGDDF